MPRKRQFTPEQRIERANARSREYNRRYPEKKKAIGDAWVKRNPGKIKAKYNRWYQKRREEYLAIRRARYQLQKNIPEFKERVRREVQARKKSPGHIDRERRGHMKRKARLKGAKVGRINLHVVRERCNGICGICNLPIEGDFHYDHVVPLARGGAHSTENLQISHPRCNMSKKARLQEELAA